MSIIFADIECYRNFFYVGFKRHGDGYRVGFELSERSSDFPVDRIRSILMKNTIVGYNCNGYDIPLLFTALKGVSTFQLKLLSDGIIRERIPWWKAESYCGVKIPRTIDCIDLIETQPNAVASLKTLNGRLHGRRMQDLPINLDADLTHEQMDITADYCLHSDLDATENLFVALKEPLKLRVALGEVYGQDFRSKSDSQIGEAILKHGVYQATGVRPKTVDVPAGETFRYQIPEYIKFDTPKMQDILRNIRETDFQVKNDGKVDLPKWLRSEKIVIGNTTYNIGIGGLHSTESNRVVMSDTHSVLIDADVASMYPTLILNLGLFPPALGKIFLTIYGKIRKDRLTAKKLGKEVKDRLKSETLSDAERLKLETELLAHGVSDKGLKIALNGIFGKLGSVYSVCYAPHLLLAVTLTGQLSLLMLIERAEREGIEVVSGNTDGVVFRCPRDKFEGFVMKDGRPTDRLMPSPLETICSQWEKDTSMTLEFAEYKALYNQSVNSYFALKADGGHKRKGPIANPHSSEPDDRDERALLMKNPQMSICSDAALYFIKNNTPVEETILNCRDIRQFVTVINAKGGASWKDQYLGKVVRFYWSTEGERIFKVTPHPTTGNHPSVPKTEGSAPCMTLPDDIPADLDYQRYIQEAYKILREVGFYSRQPLNRNLLLAALL